MIEQPIFQELSDKYKKSKVQIILRWHIQDGNIVFPGANKPEHIKENLDIYDFQLTDKEMQEIGKIDCGKRYYYLEPDKAAKTYLGMKLDFDAQP